MPTQLVEKPKNCKSCKAIKGIRNISEQNYKKPNLSLRKKQVEVSLEIGFGQKHVNPFVNKFINGKLLYDKKKPLMTFA